MLPIKIRPHYSCTDTFGSLSASEFLQGPHYCRRDRCLSEQWSGTTLGQISVPLPCLLNTTDNSRPMEWPRRGGSTTTDNKTGYNKNYPAVDQKSFAPRRPRYIRYISNTCTAEWQWVLGRILREQDEMRINWGIRKWNEKAALLQRKRATLQ